MAILRERVSWSKSRTQNETRRSVDLTPEEQICVKAALRLLVKRHGTVAKLAAVMRAKRATVLLAASKRGAVSAGIALWAARAAGVPLEDLLSGTWPLAGAYVPTADEPLPQIARVGDGLG